MSQKLIEYYIHLRRLEIEREREVCGIILDNIYVARLLRQHIPVHKEKFESIIRLLESALDKNLQIIRILDSAIKNNFGHLDHSQSQKIRSLNNDILIIYNNVKIW